MLNFSPQDPAQLMQAAYAHHMAGRLPEAERLYRQVLALNPNHADAYHLLGALACQLQQFNPAVELLARAVALNPRHAIYRSNFGEACRLAGQLDRAESEFRQAIALDPRLFDAQTNLATLLLARERWDEARTLLESVTQNAPTNVIAWRLYGDALAKLRRPDPAIVAYQRALALKPDFVDAEFNLAGMLCDANRFEEGVTHYRKVIAATPDDWDARLQLSDALARLNRLLDAYAELRALVDRNPNHQQALSRLANLLRNGDQVDEALRTYDRAIQLAPDDWITRSNMAFALRDQARLAEAVAVLRDIVNKHPESSPTRSGLIFTMYLLPGISREEIRIEQQKWNRAHADPVAAQRLPHPNPRDPHKRLRIGYVSSDFRSHPVGRFMFPLIKNHDRSRVEVFAYRGSRTSDAMTDQIAQAADHFTSLTQMTDDQAAAAIRADGIDILVDLNNHTIDNRMLLFARKPAPVQISYLAFCADTGLETIDWRMTDPFIDPPGTENETPFEKPLRLAETYWCYAPMPQAGEVTPLPALTNGHITFGSFNYFSKVNDEVLALWARLLHKIPTARLMIHVPKGSRQTHVNTFFASHGIDTARLTLIGRVSESEYFQNYSKIDIALDTFPWAGGTTTCDALYMGVPVITLAAPPGNPLQRGGISILTNLTRPTHSNPSTISSPHPTTPPPGAGAVENGENLEANRWITGSAAQYLDAAVVLASDLPGLAAVRHRLRTHMQRSILMDAPRFARHMEDAFAAGWATFCALQ